MLELVQCMTHTLLTQKHIQHIQFFAVIDGGVIDGVVADSQDELSLAPDIWTIKNLPHR